MGREVRVVEVKSAKERRLFWRLPQAIYSHCPERLGLEEKFSYKLLNPKYNRLLSEGEHKILLAMRDQRPVARLLIGKGRNPGDGDGRGYFALFDAYEDYEAVDVLFEEAKRCQRWWGNVGMVGPYAPELYDFGSGILVEGHDAAAGWKDVDNHSYYSSLLETCGFYKLYDQLLYEISVGNAQAALKAKESALGWAQSRFKIRCEPMNLKIGRKVYRDLYAVYRKSDPVAEYISFEEFIRALNWLKPYIGEGYGVLAYVRNEPAGFLLALGDMQHAAYNQWFKLMTKKIKSFDRVRALMVYVSRRHLNKGVYPLMMAELLSRLQKNNVNRVRAGTIREDNQASRTVLENMGAQREKTYRIYESIF